MENNLKNVKAFLKNILHIKGSEVTLDFKGTLKKKVVFKTALLVMRVIKGLDEGSTVARFVVLF